MSTDRPTRLRLRARAGDARGSEPGDDARAVVPAHRVKVKGVIRRIRIADAPPLDAEQPAPPPPEDWQERLESAHVEGLEHARRELTARFESALREVTVERNRLRRLTDDWGSMMEPHLVELALVIAERLVVHEIANGAVKIRPLVVAAVREIRDVGATGEISVIVHPDDFASLHPVPTDGEMAGVRIVSDASIGPGECRLTSHSESACVTLDSRMEQLRRTLGRLAPTTIEPPANEPEENAPAPSSSDASNDDVPANEPHPLPQPTIPIVDSAEESA